MPGVLAPGAIKSYQGPKPYGIAEHGGKLSQENERKEDSDDLGQGFWGEGNGQPGDSPCNTHTH